MRIWVRNEENRVANFRFRIHIIAVFRCFEMLVKGFKGNSLSEKYSHIAERNKVE